MVQAQIKTAGRATAIVTRPLPRTFVMTLRASFLFALLALLVLPALTACGDDDPPVAVDADGCPVNAAPDSAFCRGKAAFNDRALAGLAGNGRSCADCHVEADHFQLSPAAA